jgi:phosphatidate cytidylyltransferase
VKLKFDALAGRSELSVRIVSAVVMAAVAVICLWVGSWLYLALLIAITVLMAIEWANLTRNDGPDLKLLGIAYVLFPIAGMLIIRHTSHGLWLSLWTIGLVCATDIGAYFTGRYFGGPKLAPSISPSKTWSGLVGGVVAAGVAGPLIASHGNLAVPCFVLGAPLGLLAQLGDLFESFLKRHAGVKDSGSILPGHGGVLDRIDGLIPVAIVVAFFELMNWV